jgi:hypothetical protein
MRFIQFSSLSKGNMKRDNKRQFHINIKSIVAVIATAWSAFFLISLVWNVYQVKRGTQSVARIQARDAFLRDIVYRRWNSGHGGVYVPVTKLTPPNQYLEIEEREITTLSGKTLTMVNPAYMTRQVHELASTAYNMHGHITSLKPIRLGQSHNFFFINANH